MVSIKHAESNVVELPRADLENRIADALTADLSSEELQKLLREVERADEEAQELSRKSRDAALDPKIRPGAVSAHRRQMEDAQFQSDRMRQAAKTLRERLDEVLCQEQAARESHLMEEATKRQEAAAAMLRERYPVLAAELADLLKECAEADAQCRRLTKKHVYILAGWDPLNNPGMGIKLPVPGPAGRYFWPAR